MIQLRSSEYDKHTAVLFRAVSLIRCRFCQYLPARRLMLVDSFFNFFARPAPNMFTVVATSPGFTSKQLTLFTDRAGTVSDMSLVASICPGDGLHLAVRRCL